MISLVSKNWTFLTKYRHERPLKLHTELHYQALGGSSVKLINISLPSAHTDNIVS